MAENKDFSKRFEEKEAPVFTSNSHSFIKIEIVVAVVAVILFVAWFVNGLGGTTGAGGNAALYKTNQAVDVNNAEFFVTNATLATSYNTGFGEQKSANQFLIVNVTVKNIGKEALAMDNGNFVAIDGNGNKYDPKAVFTPVNGVKAFSIVDKINPGLSQSGVVVFEVPAGVKGLALRVSDNFVWNVNTKAIDLGI